MTLRAGVLLTLLALTAAAPAAAQEASAPDTPPTAGGSEAQVLDRIQRELAALRAENAELRRRVDALSSPVPRARVVEDTAQEPSTPPTPQKATTGPVLFPTESSDPYATPQNVETYAAFAPGRGYKIADTPHGELNISAYMLARYINQLPDDRTSFVDHNGNTQTIDPRDDIQWQRAMVWLYGWAFDPRFHYQTIFWTVNSTNQVAIAGALTYHFNNLVEIGTGINRLPGTYTMMGSHPYWLATDRVMADEFFRPGMTGGVWVTGEMAPRLHYFAMLGNNLSELGINASKLTRNNAWGAALWWMPSTGEFGPRGGMGDYEHHEELATRFGLHYTHSREDRFSQNNVSSPDNTQIRLSDSLLLFATGSLAPGVTVDEANFDMWAANIGLKYKGWALHGEGYYRLLSNMTADGPLPLSTIKDSGFYLQTSYDLIAKKVQLYAGTSQIYGQFNDSWEYFVGANWYPFDTRNLKVNGMVIDVHRSAVSSLFGYYVGGQTGPTVTMSVDVLY
jgi:hypothetical protein